MTSTADRLHRLVEILDAIEAQQIDHPDYMKAQELKDYRWGVGED